MLSTLCYFAPHVYYESYLEEGRLNVLKNAPFVRSSFQNRMKLAGANGPQLLSVPLSGGRSQRAGLKQVRISYDSAWQQNHLRSLQSVYKRSPFFEYYEADLEHFYQQHFVYLYDLNVAAFELSKRFFKLSLDIYECDSINGPTTEREPRPYHQIFNDRNGFVPDCSILDFLFNCGPQALKKI